MQYNIFKKGETKIFDWLCIDILKLQCYPLLVVIYVGEQQLCIHKN